MFVASFSRTMAGAKRVVPDHGISLRRPLAAPAEIAKSKPDWLAERREKIAAVDAVLLRAAVRFRLNATHRATSASQIMAQVAAWHGLTADDMTGPSRKQKVVKARFDAMAAVYLNCQVQGRRYSLPELGRAFGRDHTTALHALRQRGL